MKQPSKTFCIYPFTHMATKTDGTLKLCCRSEPITNVHSQSVLETWNGADYKRIRKQMLAGERPPECESCWRMEDVGARSMRMRALGDYPDSRWNLYANAIEPIQSDGSVIGYPKTLELKISNLCNLKCRMCSPLDSSLWGKDWWEVEDLMDPHNTRTFEQARALDLRNSPQLAAFEDCESWWKEFDILIDHLDLVEFAGGEPLIDPIHFRILGLLQRRADKIRLKYSTNLTRLKYRGQDILEYWKNFAGVSIYASIDGIYDVYEYIRTGAKFEEVSANLKTITEAKSVRFDEIAVACTIQVYNAFQLPQIIDYFLKMNIKFHTHRVTYPAFLNTQILPRAMKNKLSEQIMHYQAREPRSSFEQDTFLSVNRHLQDHLNFMNGADESHLLPVFVDFTRRLDRLRNTDAGILHPMMRELLIADNIAPICGGAILSLH